MRPLLKIKDPQEFSSGLWPDRPKNQSALWREGENITFRDGKIFSRGQYASISSVIAPVQELSQAFVDGKRRIYVGTYASVWKYEEGVPTFLYGSSPPGCAWVLQPFGTWLMGTNGVDTPKIWKNTGTMVNWPTVPFAKARTIGKLEVFPVLFEGQEAAWPAYNDPENFVPAPGNRAGRFFIRDLDGDITACAPLRGALVYYTQNMWGFMNYVGGDLAMSFTEGGTGIGAISPYAVTYSNGYHFGIGQKGIWQSDGSSFTYILPPKLRDWLMENADFSDITSFVVYANEQEDMVEFYFACKDGQRRGLGYAVSGPTAGTWTIFKEAITAASTQGAYPFPVVGSYGGGFGLRDPLTTDSLQWWLNSFPLDAGSVDQKKRWQNLQLTQTRPGATIQARVGFSDDYNAEPDWTAWADTDGSDIWFDRESIFITVQLRKSETIGPTEKRLGISGIEISGVPVGRKR